MNGGLSVFKVGLDVDYNVASDATLFFGIGQASYSVPDDFPGKADERYTKFGVKVSF